MKPLGQVLASWGRFAVQLAVSLGFAVGVVLLLLWLAGKFEPKVPPTSPAPAAAASIDWPVVPVEVRRLPRTETAVGSIRAVHETSIGSKLLARVVEVNLKAGQKVKQGEVLVRLDDSDLQARLQQAKAALASATAAHEQAISDEKRARQLIESKALSQQEFERAATALRAAEAELRRARETINEVQATLEWATIRAPMDGIVIDKKVDVGDTVVPGQVVVTLFDPKRMQLVANVRESLAQRLQVGQSISVRVEGLNKECTGTVSEIVPEAQSASRTFQVKVTGPCPAGVYTGMFGRILIPLEEELVLVIPQRAVRRVGQLELVDIVSDGRVVRRAVRTGRLFGNDVEVLSGLRDGEQVVCPASATPSQEVSHE
jgi:RND family efflux transporter MFP subunit